MNYYNDNDPSSIAWLKELIKQGVIPPGEVDGRSIKDVTKSDLTGYTQCHFFAGVGGWSEALRIAGVGSDVPLWTGSCPCQPYSCAGKREGNNDPRNLWPEFYRLIAECKPELIFGEQVEAAIGQGWIDGVQTDLAREGYSFGFTVLGAHSAGAPHIRQRIYWVADSKHSQWWPVNGSGENGRNRQDFGRKETYGELGTRGEICRMADTSNSRCDNPGKSGSGSSLLSSRFEQCSNAGRMEHPAGNRWESWRTEPDGRSITGGCSESRMGNSDSEPGKFDSGKFSSQETRISGQGLANGNQFNGFEHTSQSLGFWSSSIWLPCTDGKQRRIEPESFPLSYGIPASVAEMLPLFGKLGIDSKTAKRIMAAAKRNRIGALRGYGNAICPETAAEFINAYYEVISEIERSS